MRKPDLKYQKYFLVKYVHVLIRGYIPTELRYAADFKFSRLDRPDAVLLFSFFYFSRKKIK